MHGAKPHAIFLFSFKLLLSPQFLPKHLLAASSLLQQSELGKAQRKTLHKQSSCLQDTMILVQALECVAPTRSATLINKHVMVLCFMFLLVCYSIVERWLAVAKQGNVLEVGANSLFELIFNGLKQFGIGKQFDSCESKHTACI